MSRTGRIVQSLWDASQVQAQQREYFVRIGEIAIALVREGKLQNIAIERILAKLDRTERILKRQELTLKGYQTRSNLSTLSQLEEDDVEPTSTPQTNAPGVEIE